jgi:hypothetical protein
VLDLSSPYWRHLCAVHPSVLHGTLRWGAEDSQAASGSEVSVKVQ